MKRHTGQDLEYEIANASDWHTTFEQFCAPASLKAEPSAKSERERWILGNFLQRFGFPIDVFPTKLVQSERPDFRIGQSGELIGIEVTELTTVKNKDINCLVEKHAIDFYSRPALPADANEERERALTKEEQADKALAIAKVKNENSPPFDQSSEEKKLADMIARLIRRKCASFEKEGFDRFPRNLLVIYENASPVPPNMGALSRYLQDIAAPFLRSLKRHQEIWLLTPELIQICPERVGT